MKVAVIHPAELGPPELDKWRTLQGATPSLANPFLSPEFTIAVGSLRSRARVALLFDGPEIAGFFPFERRGPGYGVPIAAGHNDCQGVVHHPDLDWNPQELLRACGLAVWEFDNLATGQTTLDPYVAGLVPSPIMDLSAGFHAFIEHLRHGPNRLRDIARKKRKLAREIGELRFVFDVRDRRALHKVMAWKSAQYLRTGDRDRFARPWMIELLEELLNMRTEGFSGVLSMLYAGDEPVAGHFGLRSDRVLAHWFPAYATDFARYSPGLVMHLELAEGAAAAGVHHIEMGSGAEDYKQWFRSRDVAVAKGRVVSGAPGAAMHWVRRAPVDRLYRIVNNNPALSRTAKRIRASWERDWSSLQHLHATTQVHNEGEECGSAACPP